MVTYSPPLKRRAQQKQSAYLVFCHSLEEVKNVISSLTEIQAFVLFAAKPCALRLWLTLLKWGVEYPSLPGLGPGSLLLTAPVLADSPAVPWASIFFFLICEICTCKEIFLPFLKRLKIKGLDSGNQKTLFFRKTIFLKCPLINILL